MQIAVQAESLSLTTQVRAYVEYRMFSATSRFGTACERLSITLDERDVFRTGARYRCSAVLDLTPVGQIRVSATSDRLYAAVDEAADRLARGGDHHFVTKGRVGRGKAITRAVSEPAAPATDTRRYVETAQPQG